MELITVSAFADKERNERVKRQGHDGHAATDQEHLAVSQLIGQDPGRKVRTDELSEPLNAGQEGHHRAGAVHMR